jgi:DNA replication protein DnaC
METIDPKHQKKLIKAFDRLSENQLDKSRYERKPKQLTFGSREKLKPVFIESFKMFDKRIVGLKWLPEYEQVLDWLEDNKGKGLYLCGDFGRGKSSIILGVIRPLFEIIGKPLPGFHAIKLPIDRNFEKYWSWKYSYIDELGAESMVNDYGEKYEAFNMILNIAEQDLNILVMSSNLTAQQFCQRYGDRAMERINSLCKIIEFKGESLR